MLRKFISVLFIALGMLLQSSPTPLRALGLEPAGFVPVSVPAGITAVTPPLQSDLNGNSSPETLALNDGRLSIFSGGETVWQSPKTWHIVQAAISDLNRDGKPEITVLLWRPFRAWPADRWLPNGGRIAEFQDAEGQSCQIILIGWTRGGYHELWAGSAMADPITFFAAVDINSNGTEELVALESRYTDPKSAPARTLKVWEWNGFGFTAVSSIDGTFSKISLVRANNSHILILVP